MVRCRQKVQSSVCVVVVVVFQLRRHGASNDRRQDRGRSLLSQRRPRHRTSGSGHRV